MSYNDKDGDRHSACHTSKAGARAQIAAIEIDESSDELDESWVPRIVQMVEAIENELAVLAGAFSIMKESKSSKKIKRSIKS